MVNSSKEPLLLRKNEVFTSQVVATMLMFLGMLLISSANHTLAPLLLVPLVFSLGSTLCRLLGREEQRAFQLSLALCVLVTGLSQLYAKGFFGLIQTTTDAVDFYDLATGASTHERWADLRRMVNAPLAASVWSWLYRLNTDFGFENGPWVGILFNSLLVGLSGSMTVQTGRYIFGQDAVRLKLLGTLFAGCGIFWLFGALHMRDGFALFLNSLFLYGFVRALALPRIDNLLLLCTIVFFVTWSMIYIRIDYVLLIPLCCMLGLVSWTRRHFGGARLFLLIMVGFTLAVGLLDVIAPYYWLASTYAIGGYESYRIFSEMAGKGLGHATVVGQPLPIRLLAGSVYMHIFPIPLWAYFDTTLGEYHWIKGYQGFFLAAIVPFGLVGIYTAMKQAIRGGPKAPPLCFLALFTISTTLAVVATSLETRHHGQFLPAFLMLSAIPARRSPRIHSQLKLCCVLWYGAVVVIHLLWIVLKKF